MPLLLCRHLDKRTEWQAVVTQESFTLGYSESATVPVPDGGLAAKEVQIFRRGDRHLFRDLVEKDRVRLNGAVVREGLLKDGDRLQLGRIGVVFFEDSRPGGGQILLQSGGGDAEVGDDSWNEPAQDAAAEDAKDGGPGAGLISRGAILASMGGALAAGIGFGLLLFQLSREEEPLAAAAAAPPAAGITSANPAPPGPKLALEARGTDPLKKLETILAGAPPAKPEARGAFTLAPAADPESSRRALFRLFLDLAGRPPTRAEERELLPLAPEPRWRRVLAIAGPGAGGGDPQTDASAGGSQLAAAFGFWLGRAPTASEAEELSTLITAERPAGLWISAIEEYRRSDWRRPRSGEQRAASLIVDLLDRPPASPAEVELVRDALRLDGAAEETARTLAHSPEGRLPEAAGDGPWWEDEVFRFLLKAPGERQRREVPRLLDGLPVNLRRRVLVLALATLPDYETY